MPKSVFLSTVFAAAMPTMAFAHGGHVGELAGHSHWVGWAAAAAAAALAAWAAKRGNKADSEAEEDTAADDGEQSPEPAEA
ncbi:MAG: hypothetical protein RIA09_09290 [Hoeflea sp.]|jgi:membrane protein implicated in regulation of membrane protease activity|uniref:DUF6732 family protein n=1 Tax=Hoeflea sp. TaxID=1940281 RepID=UPI0032EF8A90